MIRAATEKDLMDILQIYNDAILHTTAVYDYNVHTIEERKQWYEKKKQEGYPLLVFEKNKRVAGFATFGPFRAWPAYKYTIEHSVYVHGDFRREGIAIKLMQDLMKIANEREMPVCHGSVSRCRIRTCCLPGRLMLLRRLRSRERH